MHPYREPGVAIAPDEDTTKLLEERIMDRAHDLRQRGVSGDLVARVSPMSFRSMTLRLGAKVDLDESGQECFLMFTASGQVLVVASQVIAGECYILEKLGEESEDVLNARLRRKLLARADQLLEQNQDERACGLLDAYRALRGNA